MLTELLLPVVCSGGSIQRLSCRRGVFVRFLMEQEL